MENEHQPEVMSASALELIQRAEIDQQVATARHYPRPGISVIKKRMLDFATLDEETAESCFYSLPRDGKTITGPSVRLAEIAVSCWGNLRAASRVIGNDGRILTSQAACHDLENNVLISVEVQRRITGKNGKTFSDDMIVTTGNAANSIALRNAVFKVIPGALTKSVYDAARACAVGNASTLSTKRLKVVKRLNGMEVDTPRILARLGRASVDDITLEDLEILIGAGTAIKDSDTTVDEAFPPVAKPGAAQAPIPSRPETVEDREVRLRRQVEEQAPVAAAEPVFSDAEAMMRVFLGFVDRLGKDTVSDILTECGIASDADFGIADEKTIRAYRTLQKMEADVAAAEARNVAPPADPPPSAPRRGLTLGTRK